jgi:hypothetical protein
VQELSNLLWALARLRHIPPDLWMDACWAESAAALGGAEPRHLAVSLWALVEMGQAPPDEWLEPFLEAAGAGLPQQSAQGLAMLAWSLAQLGLAARLPDGWLRRHSAAAAARWGEFDTLALERLAAGLGKLRHRPGAGWLAGLQRRALALLPEMNHHNLAGLLWGLSLMRAAPQPAFLEQVYEAVERELPAFDYTNPSKVREALAAWGSEMPAGWQRRWEALAGAYREQGLGPPGELD